MDIHRTGPAGETVDTPRHRALASRARVVILQLIRGAPDGLTAGEVAEATGRHPTTVRDHLDQLTAAGLLIRQRRSDGSPGRPAWRYRAGQPPERPGVGPYRELAGALVEHIGYTADDPRAAGVSAGRAWGRKLAATAGGRAGAAGPGQGGQRLVEVLDRLGFAPRVVAGDATDPAVVHLHSCPFLDLVDGSADVVCGLHLGVVRGAMGAAGESAGAVALEPFGAAGACVVRLRSADDRPDPFAPPPPGSGAGSEESR